MKPARATKSDASLRFIDAGSEHCIAVDELIQNEQSLTFNYLPLGVQAEEF